MSVLAVTPIKHNGELYPVGTDVTKLPDVTEADIQSMVDAGGAVELGDKRKYSDTPTPVIASGMEASALREEILTKANNGDPIPPSTTAEGVPSQTDPSAPDTGGTPEADDAAAKQAKADIEAANKRAAEEAEAAAKAEAEKNKKPNS